MSTNQQSTAPHATVLQHSNLFTDQMDESVAFFTQALGLSVISDVPQGDYRWVVVGAPGQASVLLCDPHPGQTPEQAQALLTLMAAGGLHQLVFTTDDLDAAWATAQAAGAQVIQEPTDQFWGTRDFALREPAGAQVRVQQSQH